MDKFEIDRALEAEESRDGYQHYGSKTPYSEYQTLKVRIMANSLFRAMFTQECYPDSTFKEILASLEHEIKLAEMQEPQYFRCRGGDDEMKMQLEPLGIKENQNQTLQELGFFSSGYDTLVINDNGGNG